MKKWWLVLLLCSFVSASVSVHDYDVNENYFFSENLNGTINLTINNEGFREGIVFRDQEVELGYFLNENDVDFSCSPVDCSSAYTYSSSVKDKSFFVSDSEDKYIGFVVRGEDVTLEDINFKLTSDFGREPLNPLSIEFFEESVWNFDYFSDEFLSKDWGCFNFDDRVSGPKIGTSKYCEMIYIKETGALRAGAGFNGEGDVRFYMSIFPESGSGGFWGCSFNASEDDGCDVNFGLNKVFSAGYYQVCINSDSSSDYTIYQEAVSPYCGFVYDVGPETSSKDYAIFAQSVKYENASALEGADFGLYLSEMADSIIDEKYGRDCSEGCVLPLKISGVSQNMRIYDVDLDYKTGYESYSSDLVYDLEEIGAGVDFSGVLDLGLLGFGVSDNEDFIVKLGDEVLFSEQFSIILSPMISSIFPSNPPAGVSTRFSADVDFDYNESLVYSWDFGDGKTATTNVPYVSHTYSELKGYNLSLEVAVGYDVTSSKTILVTPVSPEDAISITLDYDRKVLSQVKLTILSFPDWYGSKVSSFLMIDSLDNTLNQLSSRFNNASSDEDFLMIAKDLYDLNVPLSIEMDISNIPFLISKSRDINVEAVFDAFGETGTASEGYINSIFSWQEENIEGSFSKRRIDVSYLDGTGDNILNVYSFDISSNAGEDAYFFINKPISELTFKRDVGAVEASGITAVPIGIGEKKLIDFYYQGLSEVGVFVSPSLGSLVIEADIETLCNFNYICEEELGEDFDNCRSDCKPVGKAATFFILGFIFLLVIYTGLQLWYKYNYESYLFKARAQIYNLLMYVANARAQGMKDLRIAAELRSKGWSSERVNYIIKKSRGKRVGLPEIIPISLISAYLMDRKARQNVVNQNAVSSQEQPQVSK